MKTNVILNSALLNSLARQQNPQVTVIGNESEFSAEEIADIKSKIGEDAELVFIDPEQQIKNQMFHPYSKRPDVKTRAEEKTEELSSKFTPVRTIPKIGRNEQCPCKSSKKYRHCHGK